MTMILVVQLLLLVAPRAAASFLVRQTTPHGRCMRRSSPHLLSVEPTRFGRGRREALNHRPIDGPHVGRSKKNSRSSIEDVILDATTEAEAEAGIGDRDLGRVEGIGGRGGLVYDVNKVKKNLVQETISRNKNELLELLGTPGLSRSDAIDDIIVGLVQFNPVSTTTDSNLLDGVWALAYFANNATYAVNISRFGEDSEMLVLGDMGSSYATSSTTEPSLSPENLRPWRYDRDGMTDSPFRSTTREIRLEELADDEDAYVVDRTRILGGIAAIEERYEVDSLTRTSLEIDLSSKSCKILERVPINLLPKSNASTVKHLRIKVLYLDSDLCICTSLPIPARGDQTRHQNTWHGPLLVYTKSERWTGKRESTSRKVRFLLAIPSWLSTIHSPFRIRERIRNVLGLRFIYSLLRGDKESAGDLSLAERENLFIQKDLGTSEITVLRLGSTNVILEEQSWQGDDDPFAHLDAETRQEVIKEMSIEEIKKAGRLAKKRAERARRKQNRKPKQFKKPPAV